MKNVIGLQLFKKHCECFTCYGGAEPHNICSNQTIMEKVSKASFWVLEFQCSHSVKVVFHWLEPFPPGCVSECIYLIEINRVLFMIFTVSIWACLYFDSLINTWFLAVNAHIKWSLLHTQSVTLMSQCSTGPWLSMASQGHTGLYFSKAAQPNRMQVSPLLVVPTGENDANPPPILLFLPGHHQLWLRVGHLWSHDQCSPDCAEHWRANRSVPHPVS